MRDGLWRSPGLGEQGWDRTALCSESPAGITEGTVGKRAALSRLCPSPAAPRGHRPAKGCKGSSFQSCQVWGDGVAELAVPQPSCCRSKACAGPVPIPCPGCRVQLLLGEMKVERSMAHGLLRHPRAAHSSHVVIQAAQATGELCGEGDQSCVCVSPDEALRGVSNASLASASFTDTSSILPHDVLLLLYHSSLHEVRVRSQGRDLGQRRCFFAAAQPVQYVLSSLGIASCTGSWERAVTGSCLACFKVYE